MSANRDSSRILLDYVDVVRDQQRIIERSISHVRRMNDNLTMLLYECLIAQGSGYPVSDSRARATAISRDSALRRSNAATNTTPVSAADTRSPPGVFRTTFSAQERETSAAGVARTIRSATTSALSPHPTTAQSGGPYTMRRRRMGAGPSWTQSLYTRLPPPPPINVRPPPLDSETQTGESLTASDEGIPPLEEVVPPRLHRNISRTPSDVIDELSITTPRFFGDYTRIQPTHLQVRRSTTISLFCDVSGSTQTICPIDRATFEDADSVMMIKHCRHIFRELNLRRHFRNSPRCPLCRYDIRDYTPETSMAIESVQNASDAVIFRSDSDEVERVPNRSYIPGQV